MAFCRTISVVVLSLAGAGPAVGEEPAASQEAKYTPPTATSMSATEARVILDLDIFHYFQMAESDEEYGTPLLRDEYKRTPKGKEQTRTLEELRRKLWRQRLFVEAPIQVSKYDLRRKGVFLYLSGNLGEHRNQPCLVPKPCVETGDPSETTFCFPSLPISESRKPQIEGETDSWWTRTTFVAVPRATAVKMEKDGFKVFFVFTPSKVVKYAVVSATGHARHVVGARVQLLFVQGDEVLLMKQYK